MTKWKYLSLVRFESAATIIGGLGSGTYVYTDTEKIKVCGTEEIEVINYMNRLGDMEWELTGIIHNPNRANASYTCYMFKRRVE